MTTPLSNLSEAILFGAIKTSATVRVHVRRTTTGQPDHYDGRVVGWASLHSKRATRQLVLSVQLLARGGPRSLITIGEHNITRVELV